MPFYKVNKTWTDEKNNITYYDGSTSFQIIFDSNIMMSIKAYVPFTLNSIYAFIDIRYSKNLLFQIK